jgi:hypothetical protein
MPLITAASDGRRMVVAAADRAALALGIRPAMPLAHARAMVPGLTVVDADPEADAAALHRVAAWCLRYSPLTASLATRPTASGSTSPDAPICMVARRRCLPPCWSGSTAAGRMRAPPSPTPPGPRMPWPASYPIRLPS